MISKKSFSVNGAGIRGAIDHLGAVQRQAAGVLGIAPLHRHHDAEAADRRVDDRPERLKGAAVFRHPPIEQIVRRDRALARQQRADLVVLEDDVAVRIDDEADVEEEIGPVLVASLGLRHDEHAPFLRELAEAVGFGTGNVDRAGMREFLVIEVENLVVEALQRAFGNRDQANRNVEVGQPIRRVGEAFEMFEIFFDFGATAHAPKGRNQSDRVIRFNHRLSPKCPRNGR